MTRRHRSRGFTVIEIVITMIIVGILAAVTTVGLQAVANRTKTERDTAVLDTVFSAETRFSSLYDTYTAWPADLDGLGAHLAVTQGPSPDPTVVSMAVSATGAISLAIKTESKVCAWSRWPASGTPGKAVTGTLPPGQVCEARAVLPPGDPAVTATGTARWDDAPTSSNPATVPGPPRNIGATPTASGTSVFWATSASNGGATITGYTATLSASGQPTQTCTAPNTACVISPAVLTAGVTYTLTVTATNSVGDSEPATTTVTRVVTPGQVQGLTATAGNASATLAWTAVGSTPATPVAGYRIYVNAVLADATTATTYTVSGLDNGTSYSVSVAAFGAAGQGVPSSPVNVTPSAAPGHPTAVTASIGNTTSKVTWTAPASTGGSPITSYQVTASAPGQTPQTCTTAATTCTLTGLANGVSYTVSVTATNTTGTSTPTTTTVTPASSPGVPAGVAIAPGNQTLTVTWAAGTSTSAAPLSGYRVFTDGVLAGVTVTTTFNLTGLANGTTYTIRVASFGPAGQSAQSAPVTGIPRTVPGAPSAPTATPGSGTATVTWAAPTNDGGSPIITYTVTAAAPNQPTATCTTAATTCNVTGLTNGLTYTFSVAATNAAGTGIAATVTATPVGVPGAPTLTLTPTDRQIGLSWSTIPSLPSAPVTGYRVFIDGVLTQTTTAATYTASGLTNGTSYTFAVAAFGPAGQGPSTPQTGTPRTVPGTPTAVTATPAPAAANVTWTAPASNGGSPIVSYTATATAAGQTTVSCLTASTSCTINLLASGVTYNVTVIATNAAGDSTPASAAVTPIGPPAQVTGLVASAANTSLVLTWDPVTSTSAAPLTGYRVYVAGALWATVTSPTVTVNGLTNGTAYNVQVAAYGPGGQGTSSSIVTGTPRGVPGAPTIGTITAAGQLITIPFTAPTGDGGSPITGYTATMNTGATTTCTASPCTFAGTPGATYTATVTATNVAGMGAPSAVSNAVTTVPAAPTGLGGGLYDAIPTGWRTTWNAASGATSYNLTVTRTAGSQILQTYTAPGTDTAHIFGSITPGTTIQFQIAACNVAGCSPVASTVSTTPTTPVTDRIVGDAPTIWWPLTDDATNPTVLDYSGNNNNGAFNPSSVGATRALGSIGEANGMHGFKAAGQSFGQWNTTYFGGSGTFGAQIYAGNTLNTRDVSMAAWIFMDGGAHSGMIMGLTGSGGNTVALGVGAGTFNDDQPGYKLVALTEGVCWMTGTSSMPAGWNHVAITVSSSGVVTTYLNGVQETTSSSCAPQAAYPTGTPIVSGLYSRRLVGVYVADAQFFATAKPATTWSAQKAAAWN